MQRLGKYLTSLTKPELEAIEEKCNFTEEEKNVFKAICKGYTVTSIAIKSNMSERTIARKIESIGSKIKKLDGSDSMKKEVPISEKYNLTLDEAAAYFNMGVDKIREIVNENKHNLVLMVGTKKLIKKKKMEEYLDRLTVI